MLPDQITVGEKYGPAMEFPFNPVGKIQADAYFEELVEHTMRCRPCGRADAEDIERSNLGYYAGYYSHDTRLRVERLFSCRHPIFGDARAGAPSPEAALEAGKAMAKREERTP